jgi:hypothetical protein
MPGIHWKVFFFYHSLVGQQEVTGTNVVLVLDRVLGKPAWNMDLLPG